MGALTCSSLFLSFVCGVSLHTILTHTDGVRLTQPPDPPPGVTHPLGQDTVAVVSGPPVCKAARPLGPPGTLERSDGAPPLPTAVPEKSGPSCFHFGSV